MEILVGEQGNLKKIEVDQLLQVSIRGQKFRIRDDHGKMRVMAREGFLKIEPVASNVILIDQIDDV